MSKKKLIFLLPVFFLGATLLLPSCKSTRSITRVHLKYMPFGQLLKNAEANAPTFSYFAGKLSVNYHQGDKKPVSFRIQMRVKKDSIIWMSLIPAMGIEAARVVMTNDSVKLLNRMKKNYVLGTYNLLDSMMHTQINYKMVQALLFGDFLHYPLVDSSASIDGDSYLLNMKMKVPAGDSSHILQQKIKLYPQTFLIKSMLLRESNMPGKNIRIFYNEYQKVDGVSIPLKMQIVIRARQKIVINLTFKRAEINVPHHFPFIIPGKYKKLI